MADTVTRRAGPRMNIPVLLLSLWALNKWLETFAYRISINWWMTLLAGVIVAAISIITVIGQAFKTARANPVKSLRTE